MACPTNVSAVLLLLGVAYAQGQVVIETVTVGNPGNAPDARYEAPGFGGVDYVYDIGNFEVTAGQYAAFLNAVAATDAYGLYSVYMNLGEGSCRIERTGLWGSYSYSVADDWAHRPVNFVSWEDAARFCNWLHNGQPEGTQDATTTEDGSYDLSATHQYYDTGNLEGLRTALMAVVREPDATWVVPTEDEWYKAAYHYNDGVTGNYYDYPTSSDSVPSNDLVEPTDPGNNATFCAVVQVGCQDYTVGSPYYRTEVGAHENSESPYGTFDQGGNMWEWNETVIDGCCRGLRGGGWCCHEDYGLHAADGDELGPTVEYGFTGFRVAKVSEPACDRDCDGDDDVDLYDYALWQRAFTGPR